VGKFSNLKIKTKSVTFATEHLKESCYNQSISKIAATAGDEKTDKALIQRMIRKSFLHHLEND